MFDLSYIIMVMLPGLLLGGLATLITKRTFSRYSKVAGQRGITGAQAAMQLLHENGIHDVNVEPVDGFLSDHYDPRSKTLRLSPAVYRSPSLAAIGVACHEAGHAIQHARQYAPLAMRSSLVPLTQFGSGASYWLIFGGMFLNFQPLILVGLGLFAIAVLFSLVTLPVEYDASARAKKLMVSSGIVTPQEQQAAGKVLNAAFLTYVASAVTAVLTFVYFLLRSGLLGGRDD